MRIKKTTIYIVKGKVLPNKTAWEFLVKSNIYTLMGSLFYQDSKKCLQFFLLGPVVYGNNPK